MKRGSTFFELDNWSTISKLVNGSREEMWKINMKFLDNQVAAGKSFFLTANPESPTGWFFTREVKYLKELGYKFSQTKGGWNAVK